MLLLGTLSEAVADVSESNGFKYRGAGMTRLRTVLQADYLKRSLGVALVVGTLLNLINQPEALLGDASLTWWKVVMTYAVPFFVATYGAYGALPKTNDESF